MNPPAKPVILIVDSEVDASNSVEQLAARYSHDYAIVVDPDVISAVVGGAGDGRLETIDVRHPPSGAVDTRPPPRSSYSSAPNRSPSGFRQTSRTTTGAS